MLSTAAVTRKIFNKVKFNVLLTVWVKAFRLKTFNNYAFIHFITLMLGFL